MENAMESMARCVRSVGPFFRSFGDGTEAAAPASKKVD
jgi:hypothetical protein